MAWGSVNAPVQRPQFVTLLWAVRLLRYAWMPFGLTILGRWIGSLAQIAVAAFLAFAVAQLNVESANADAVLPKAVASWLQSTNHPSMFALLAALILGVCSGVIDTLVSWSGTWIHVILNRLLTPAALASALQGYEDAGSARIDSSILIQRWLLKEVLVDFYQSGVASIIGALGTIALVMVATFRTSHRAGLICILCLILWSVLCALLMRKALVASRQAAIEHELMGRTLRSSVALRNDLSRPSAWKFWLERSRPAVNDLGRSILWQGIWAATLSGALGITASSIPLLALLLAASGGIQASVAVYLFTSRLIAPLTEISQALTVFQDQMIAIQRMHDAFAGALNFRQHEYSVYTARKSLEFEAGQVEFDSSSTLAFPDIRARAGLPVCLVGASGSGKTTLLSVLAGQRRASSGELRVDGNLIDPLSLNWRESVGILPQYPELLPGAVSSNLARFPSWSPTRQVLESTDAILKTIVQSEGADLSAGQRRAIAVMRALGCDVPVILLDEPFAGVDNRLLQFIRLAIAEVVKERIVIIALHEHDLARLDLPVSVIHFEVSSSAISTA